MLGWKVLEGIIGTLKKSGLAGLLCEISWGRLRAIYRGLHLKDEMVELLLTIASMTSLEAPSIDTPLHAFLPFKHIDICILNAAIGNALPAKDGERNHPELWKGQIFMVPWAATWPSTLGFSSSNH